MKYSRRILTRTRKIHILFLIFFSIVISGCGSGSGGSSESPENVTSNTAPSTEETSNTSSNTSTDSSSNSSSSSSSENSSNTSTNTSTNSSTASTDSSSNTSNVSDADGDGEPDSTDAYPYNPYKSTDDWGQTIDTYPTVFTASDISDLNKEGLTADLKLAADILGKYDVEWWAIGQNIEAMLALASTWCDRRIERGQLFYYEGEMGNLDRLKSICMTETAHPHASLDWNNGQNSGGTYFTSDLSTFEGWMESYRKVSLNIPSGSANAGSNRNQGYTATQSSMPFQYDPATIPSDTPYIKKEEHSVMVFHEYYHTTQAYFVASKEEIQDETGNTVRPEYGPTAFSEGSANYISEYMIRKLATDGTYTGASKDKNLKVEMQERMSALQAMYTNCPDFKIELLNYGNECDPYTFGMWATAYLTHKTNNINVFHEVFWPKINAMTYIGAFENTFGFTYDSFNAEFKTFLALPLDEQLAIIPDINFVEASTSTGSTDNSSTDNSSTDNSSTDNTTNLSNIINSGICDSASNPQDSPESETALAYLLRVCMNKAKDNPEHYYLFSDNIPQDLIDQHSEIHTYLKQIVGGYDRYVHITYELDGNNDAALSTLRSLGVMKEGQLVNTIQEVHDIRSCLGGFSAFDRWDDKSHYSFCVQPNPLTDPHNAEYRIAEGDSYRYEIMHGWIHEYFHHYQRAHTFERALAMPNDCCGLNNPVGAPAWWVEGSAGIFPDLFMYEYFEQLSYTQTNNFDFNKYTMIKISDLSTWVWQEEKTKFQDPNFSCSETEAYRDNPQCNWTFMNYFLAYYINLEKNPSFDKIPNTGLQVVWVNLLEDMYLLDFEGSFQKHVGISLAEFYQKYDDFIRNSGDTPPNNFFPDKPLNELVDFFTIDSSRQFQSSTSSQN